MRLPTLHGPRSAAGHAVLLGACGLLVAGCGGTQQDAHEPRASFAVQVVKATFPASQAVARPSALELEVRNTGQTTVPNLSVSVRSFSERSQYPGLADATRPVWIVDQGPGASPNTPVETVPFDSPGSDETATSSVWAAGPLPAGQTRTFTWQLEPVSAGTHEVAYTVSAGLNGKATASSSAGGAVAGHFTVTVAPAPPATHVNPETGGVEAGAYPVSPGA